MYTKEQLKQAETFGREAFNAGIKAPVHDKNVMSMIPADAVVGSSIPLLKAWQKGWSRAHNEYTNKLLNEIGFWDKE